MKIIFLVAIILAFIVTWFAMPVVIKYAIHRSIVDQPNERKIHEGNIPRIGGVVFVPVALFFTIVALIPVFSYLNMSVLLLFVALLLLFIVGCIDDVAGLKYRVKFIAQFVAGCLFCASGLFISNLHGVLGVYEIPELCGWAITIFAVIYCTNAINFIDGVDGQAALIAITALIYYTIVLAILGYLLYIPLCIIMTVCLVVYLRYNVFGNPENNTKTFMGDAGSLTLGCLILLLGIVVNNLYVAKEQTVDCGFVVAFAPLFLPCLDVVRVVIHRSREGRNPFEADRNHIHHKLLDYGLSPIMVTLVVIALNLAIIVMSVALVKVLNANWIILIMLVMWTAINMWLSKSTAKKNKNNTI